MKKILIILFLFITFFGCHQPTNNPGVLTIAPDPSLVQTRALLDSAMRLFVQIDQSQYYSQNVYTVKNDLSEIQYAIDNHFKVCDIPSGIYHTKGLELHPAPGETFFTIHIHGQSTYWDASGGTIIQDDSTGGAALDIQGGKGCRITGLTINGMANMPSLQEGSQKFYNHTFEDFNDGVVSTDRYAPYVGIAIDYKPNSGNSGSSGTYVENCSINGFYVGITSSPNGQSRNAECTTGRFLQFSNVNTCIANCQDQEKTCVFEYIVAWDRVYQIYSSSQFGPGTGGNYFISKVNIAGSVVQCMTVNVGGYFSQYFYDWYGESVGRLGLLTSNGVILLVERFHIDFAYPDQAGKQVLIESHGNVFFRDDVFRYYGKPDESMYIAGNATCENVLFSGSFSDKLGQQFIIK